MFMSAMVKNIFMSWKMECSNEWKYSYHCTNVKHSLFVLYNSSIHLFSFISFYNHWETKYINKVNFCARTTRTHNRRGWVANASDLRSRFAMLPWKLCARDAECNSHYAECNSIIIIARSRDGNGPIKWQESLYELYKS